MDRGRRDRDEDRREKKKVKKRTLCGGDGGVEGNVERTGRRRNKTMKGDETGEREEKETKGGTWV